MTADGPRRDARPPGKRRGAPGGKGPAEGKRPRPPTKGSRPQAQGARPAGKGDRPAAKGPRPKSVEPAPRPAETPAEHAIPGRHPVQEALRSGRRLRELLVEKLDGNEELLELARVQKVPVRRVTREELDDAAQGVLHQGVVALAPPFHYVDLHQAAQGELVVVLDGVTDPQNLGAIARSALAAGARGLVLPNRRSATVTAAAEKAAAGAFSWLPVAQVPNIVRALQDLADRGFWSVGLAGGAERSLWSSTLLDGKVALVVGAEGTGLSRLVLERVDEHVRIPMNDHAESLNASAAAAVALFEWARRRP